MAKIVEDMIVVKLSRLVRSNDEGHYDLTDNQLRAVVEKAVQEVCPSDVIVEIDRKAE